MVQSRSYNAFKGIKIMKNYISMNVNFEYGISKNVVSRTSINCEGKSYMVEWLLATSDFRIVN